MFLVLTDTMLLQAVQWLITNTSISHLLSVFILFIIYNYLIYPFYINPLRSIPGPFHYKISSIFTLNDQRIESRNVTLHKLHTKFGSIVQISPNEVSINDLKLLKTIYTNKNIGKSSFYNNFTNFGHTNAFSTINSQDHLKRKKLMNSLYTKTSILSTTSQLHLNTKVNNVVKFINKNINISIDVYELFNSLAMDVVTFYELGSQHTTDLISNIDERSVIKSFRASSSMWVYTTLLPSLYNPIAQFFKLTELINISRDWTLTKFLKAYDELTPNEDEPSLINTLYQSQTPKYSIGSEIFDHIAAGHETTGTTLTYLTWQLSRPINVHFQDELCVELSNVFQSTKPLDMIDLHKLDIECPLLNAIVWETLRLHSAIPGSEPRRISHSNEQFQININGHITILPIGTIVSCQPWSIHQTIELFPMPLVFKPERWLKQSEETLEEHSIRYKEMFNSLMTFGKGNRMCLGMNIAVLEIKLCIAQLYWRFNSTISKDWCNDINQEETKEIIMGWEQLKDKDKVTLTDLELMSMADSYTSRPMFDECFLEWNKRL